MVIPGKELWQTGGHPELNKVVRYSSRYFMVLKWASEKRVVVGDMGTALSLNEAEIGKHESKGLRGDPRGW